MPLSGGRSSVRGVSDLSAVSPIVLELAGIGRKEVLYRESAGKPSGPVPGNGDADISCTCIGGVNM